MRPGPLNELNGGNFSWDFSFHILTTHCLQHKTDCWTALYGFWDDQKTTLHWSIFPSIVLHLSSPVTSGKNSKEILSWANHRQVSTSSDEADPQKLKWQHKKQNKHPFIDYHMKHERLGLIDI